jgi:hypothetical protein
VRTHQIRRARSCCVLQRPARGARLCRRFLGPRAAPRLRRLVLIPSLSILSVAHLLHRAANPRRHASSTGAGGSGARVSRSATRRTPNGELRTI